MVVAGGVQLAFSAGSGQYAKGPALINVPGRTDLTTLCARGVGRQAFSGPQRRDAITLTNPVIIVDGGGGTPLIHLRLVQPLASQEGANASPSSAGCPPHRTRSFSSGVHFLSLFPAIAFASARDSSSTLLCLGPFSPATPRVGSTFDESLLL